MQTISEVIDERKDPFFLRGEKIGFEKGIEKGIEKGLEVGLIDAVEKIILRFPHLSDTELADIFRVTTARIATIREGLASKNK